MKFLLILLSSLLCATNYSAFASFINTYPKYKFYDDGGDPGEPLFLTEYIEKNKIDVARKLAKVDHPQLNFADSFTGYLTVNKSSNSNLFIWFIQSHADWEHSPVVLWLQGGPGASSLFGLFTENGPYQLENETTVSPRKYSWHLPANLLYIDNPIGTGFSFADSEDGYARNEKHVGVNLHAGLVQFFKLFPELKENRFYVTGESYGGKYVPAVSHYIHKFNHEGNPDNINLQGIAIGNGLSDPVHQLYYGDYLYQLGLIDMNGLNDFHRYEKMGREYINSGHFDKAFEIFDTLLDADQTKYPSLFQNLTGMQSYFNYVKVGEDKSDLYLGKFLQSSDVRKAIHVGNKEFHGLDGENKVEEYLKNDVMDSVAQWVSELLSFYHVVIYNGQLDIIVAYPLTANYLQHLKFSGSDKYKTNPRYIWKVDKEIAGYVKEAGNLTEILVRNAGHMVPSDQPKYAFDLITRLTSGKGFAKKSKYNW